MGGDSQWAGGQPSFQPSCSVKDAFIVHLLSTHCVSSDYSINDMAGYSHHHQEYPLPLLCARYLAKSSTCIVPFNPYDNRQGGYC